LGKVKLVRSIVLLLLTISCSSAPTTDWQADPDEGRITWRHFDCYQGEAALILASDEAAAAEAHQLLVRSRAAIANTADSPAGRCLVIVIGSDKDLLFETEDEYERALRKWGAESNIQMHQTESADGKQPEIDSRLALSMAPMSVSIADADLNLPATLQDQFTHVLIMPTDSHIQSVCKALVEAAFEASDASWLERQMVYAYMDPSEMMMEKITPGIRSSFVHCWASIYELPQAQINLVRAEFNLTSRDIQPTKVRDKRLGLVPPEAARAEIMSWEGTVLDDELGLGVRQTPTSYCFYVMRSMDWGLIVDLNPQRSTKDQALEGRPPYQWQPIHSDLPSRADVEAFEKLRLAHPGFTLLVKDDVTQAAAFLAAHAYWVNGLTADVAMTLGFRFGMKAEHEEALRALFAAD
jgi:hypothetical protein